MIASLDAAYPNSADVMGPRAHGRCTNRPVGQTSGCDSIDNWMGIGAQVTTPVFAPL
jgi:hypothetical protein